MLTAEPWTARRVVRLLGVGVVVAVAMTLLYTGIYYFLLGQVVTRPEFDVIATWQVLAMAPWVVLVPLAVWLAEFKRSGASVRGSAVLMHLTIAVLLAMTHSLWFAWVSMELTPFAYLTTLAMGINHFIRYHFALEVVVYGAIAVVSGSAAVAAEAAAQERAEAALRTNALRAQLADAQLRALRLQLRPHFLFNILNMVAMMIHSGDTAKAEEVVTLLGSMFRRFLEFETHNEVTLEQELDFLDIYLKLQQFRFEDRMVVSRVIDPGLEPLAVPTLILQPLIENAIKHAVAHASEPVAIDIRARREDGALVIDIVNDLPAAAASAASAGPGIGVANTRARLAELYGEDGGLSLTPIDGRMHAVLRMPAHALEES